MGDSFTCFSLKGPSSGNITKDSYWVMGGLYIDEISFLQLIGLH
jgi:hypothetical protein